MTATEMLTDSHNPPKTHCNYGFEAIQNEGFI